MRVEQIEVRFDEDNDAVILTQYDDAVIVLNPRQIPLFIELLQEAIKEA